MTKSKLALVILSFLFFSISLKQPAFYIDRPGNPEAWAESWALVLIGWISLLFGGPVNFLIWLANPLYFLSAIFLFRNNKLSFIFGLFACILAFYFSQLDTIIASESGSRNKIKSLELGYYLWFSSIAIMTLVSGITTYSNKTITSLKK